MHERYDLTTREGESAARTVLGRLTRVLDSPLMWVASPAAKLLYELSRRGDNQQQGKMALELIRAGKAQGLRRLRIRMTETAGFDVGAPLHGIPITVKMGVDGTMEIEAEYELRVAYAFPRGDGVFEEGSRSSPRS